MTTTEQKLRGALENIKNTVPSPIEGGGVGYLMHDGYGNELGFQDVNPMAALQEIYGIAEAALAYTEPWTPCSERMPTEEDADFRGFVRFKFETTKLQWEGTWSAKYENATHWQETGLGKVRPEPPKE